MNNTNKELKHNISLLEQKVAEFRENEKQKSRNARHNIWLGISFIIATTALGFIGGAIAVKTIGKDDAKNDFNEKKVNSSIVEQNDESITTSIESSNLSINSVVEMNIKSIAEIQTETAKTDKSLKQYTSSGAGSGIVVSSDGYIMTNKHVISDSNKVNVLIDGETFEGSVVGTDSELDIALLKIDKIGLQPVIFGDSSESKIGEEVIAIGNPLGQLGETVTKGIISALNRDITVNNETMNLMQTDAAVNPGNSGGGLFNLKGELVGMVVAKAKSAVTEGIGFAIPVNNLKKPLNDLKEFGYIRGKIDIEMGITDANMLKSTNLYKNYSQGVFITNVPENSNAQAAGFQSGDCIIEIDSTPISNITTLNRTLRNYVAGDTVSVKIMRQEETLTLNLQFAEKK